MAKVITCPACGNRGDAHDEKAGAFEVRGRMGGTPVRMCTKCGVGLMVPVLFGKPKIIEPDLWDRLKARWEQEFGG